MKLEIREATQGDSAALASISATATPILRKTYRPTQRAMGLKTSVLSDVKKLIALANAQAVGSVSYRFEKKDLYLSELGVLPEFQGRGVARALIDRVGEIGRKAGASRLRLYTVKETGNVPVFEKLGFAIVTEEKTDLFESDQFSQLTEVLLEKLIK